MSEQPTVEFDGFIGEFDGFVDEQYCKEIINYYKSFDDLHVFQGKYLPKHIRDDEGLFFLDPNRIHDLHPHYSQYFFKVLKEQILPIYYEKFSILQEKEYACKQLKMKKIVAGGGYHQWHYESIKNDVDRKIVVQLYLNDIKEGGETEFLYQNKRISAKRGKILLWPADWTYTHRGNPPIGKEKFILTTWLVEVNRDVLSS